MKERKLYWKFHSFPPGKVAFARGVFPTHYELIHKFGTLRKRTCIATTCNSWIAKISLGLAEISIRKQPFGMGKTLRLPLFVGPHLSNLSSTSCKSETLKKMVSRAFQGHQDRRKLTLGATSTVRGKIDEN